MVLLYIENVVAFFFFWISLFFFLRFIYIYIYGECAFPAEWFSAEWFSGEWFLENGFLENGAVVAYLEIHNLRLTEYRDQHQHWFFLGWGQQAQTEAAFAC